MLFVRDQYIHHFISFIYSKGETQTSNSFIYSPLGTTSDEEETHGSSTHQKVGGSIPVTHFGFNLIAN